MDGKIELEEDALECVDVNEFIDHTAPDGGWNVRISGCDSCRNKGD
jgi:hypothetical protein